MTHGGITTASGIGGPRRTAPLGIAVSTIGNLRQALLPAIGGAYGLRSEFAGIGFIASIAALAIVFSALASALRWWRTTYAVGDEDIRIETGLFARAARSVPYERIQDVSIEQPVLARVLGLSQVKLETGAGGADEIALAWLVQAEGHRLRELVRERREADDLSGSTDALAPALSGALTPSEVPGEVLFTMGPRRLFAFGLFEFSLAAFAVAAGAAQQFDAFLPFDIWDWDGWQARFDAPGHWLAALGPMAQAAAVAMALGVLTVVGVLTGLARTFAREWGFVLERTARGFRRRRGLLTRTDVVMPAHRVQALQIRTGALRRLGGWTALKFVSLAQDAASASHVVAPFAREQEIAPIAHAAGFALPGPQVQWRRPSPRAFVDRAVWGSLVPLAAAVGLLFTPVPAVAVLPLLALPVIAGSQYLAWRRARHALDATQVYARHGILAPGTDIAARIKLQSVEIAQGPLARRGGYATLHLGLAGGTLAFDAVPLAEARRIRAAVLASIAGVDFSDAMTA